jgi:hypothetical protein
MRSALVLLCGIVTSTRPAAAEPTRQQLADHAVELRDRLSGQGYTILVEAPFVVIGDGPASEVRRITTGFLRSKIAMLEKDFFERRPDKLIEVWLFRNERSFRAGAKKFFHEDPSTPYGYYSPDARALIMNVSGLGTLSHELVHPYMEANFPDVPAWFNEGLASLFERPSERKGHLIGLPNWRLPELKKEIRAGTLPSLHTLLHTTSEEFYDARWDAYAQARYLVYYLQEHGELHDFYTKFLADTKDRSGQAALEAVLGERLATFDAAWQQWVLAIHGDDR